MKMVLKNSHVSTLNKFNALQINLPSRVALLYPSYSGNGGKRMKECGLPVDR
jgi:hypothetical protein